jgi:hypothetical protein
MCNLSTEQSLPKILETASHEPNNLFALLNKYRVIVPGIQRHYVQGANTVKAREVRKIFIRDILSHIGIPKPFSLDFIYGPIDTEGKDAFVPVDGQQRLTTLWLLARYFAESLGESSRNIVLRQLNRFSYEDRIHASRFCHAFTSAENPPFGHDLSPSTAIKKSTWFNQYWLTDSTVAGMLNTLDTIHELKKDEFEGLSTEDCLHYMCDSLTFHLRVDQFADDIYMKMNARGLTLTQWENFKGRFSTFLIEKPDEGNGVDWDARIEVLADAYYSRAQKLSDDSEVQKLPDDAFFAFMARILVYETKKNIRKSDENKKTIAPSLIENIERLAKFTAWEKELPYVPFEEFKTLLEFIDSKKNEKDVNVKEVVKSFLAAITCATNENNAFINTPYWQGENKLVDCLFKPKNKNELDLSLCIYEYFTHFSEKPDIDTFKRNLRLMWNVLENVSAGNKDTSYNRVEAIRTIIKDAGSNKSLYYKNMQISDAAVQYAEEKDKADIYADLDQKNIELMQEVETLMHGRIRLGILNLKEDNAPLFSPSRLMVLKRLFDAYGCPKDPNTSKDRKSITLMVVAAEPYGLKDAIKLDANADDNLRMLLTTRDDENLQGALLDFIASSQQEFNQIKPKDILNKNDSKFGEQNWWLRDWRKSILQLATEENGYMNAGKEPWGRSVRCHNTGHFYLYSGGNIRGAWPINDYRIELVRSGYFETYKNLGGNFSSVEMNDGETRSGNIENDGSKCSVYFYKNHIEARKWYSEEGSVKSEQIFKIGTDKDGNYSIEELLKDLSNEVREKVGLRI